MTYQALALNQHTERVSRKRARNDGDGDCSPGGSFRFSLVVYSRISGA